MSIHRPSFLLLSLPLPPLSLALSLSPPRFLLSLRPLSQHHPSPLLGGGGMGPFTPLLLLGLSLSLLWAASNLFLYAERRPSPTERWVLLLCASAYLLASLPILLLPLDAAALQSDADGCEAAQGEGEGGGGGVGGGGGGVDALVWYPVYYATLIVGFVSPQLALPLSHAALAAACGCLLLLF